MTRLKYLLAALLIMLIAAGAGGWYWLHSANPDVLRQIVLQQCVPNQEQHRTPKPCVDVNPKGGYVLFKDRNGPAAVSADAHLPYQWHRKPAAA
ncbi:CDP-diacylglycerol pyrophosphatase [Kluyvera cryocrescens]|uniref:CDP-diacylglycerol pyrophosphatase n=1 Tax=Kluyvera cryocrescens TaxID=580 RepID=A0A485AKS8_KLUCR|nr:CDP-diacylglycerol pyrophosphatase [Kluyvera cryocrescens]